MTSVVEPFLFAYYGCEQEFHSIVASVLLVFKRVTRLSDLSDKNSVKRTYPSISYKYDTPATLKEVAKEISGSSGVSEGETFSVLKDFRTLLRKKLLSGRSVNIELEQEEEELYLFLCVNVYIG